MRRVRTRCSPTLQSEEQDKPTDVAKPMGFAHPSRFRENPVICAGYSGDGSGTTSASHAATAYPKLDRRPAEAMRTHFWVSGDGLETSRKCNHAAPVQSREYPNGGPIKTSCRKTHQPCLMVFTPNTELAVHRLDGVADRSEVIFARHHAHHERRRNCRSCRWNKDLIPICSCRIVRTPFLSRRQQFSTECLPRS